MGYSLDFRERVLAYKDKHSLTFEQTSAHFEVTIRTLLRLETAEYHLQKKR
ncbi:hypothetical protein XBO1_2100018 [Xenorhabdus bovienii str. oregonense]|uniref:Transposase n=1 Tax=Xenorhabdus bovienii str. oregonense TaxID=1398202 RepID=A0A077P5V2_XENBV|nr:hypothetical protein [Xenorhabdus bovienii]CDH05993.1 hypothetical protein XBO1_2100018 [Xenorhabdus bovienii str. oregonense]